MSKTIIKFWVSKHSRATTNNEQDKKERTLDFKKKAKILWNLTDSILCLILLITLMISNIAITQRNMS